MKYGYVRVSTKNQKLDRQFVELEKYNLDKIFQDKESGKNFNRAGYRALIRALKQGDSVYIASLDRLGRNYEELFVEWKKITEIKKADIFVLDMPILNTQSQVQGLDGKFISNLVLNILAYVAQKEREKTKERQKQGIAIAKEKGIKFGRPSIQINDYQMQIIESYRKHQIALQQALLESGLSKGTFFRKMQKMEAANT